MGGARGVGGEVTKDVTRETTVEMVGFVMLCWYRRFLFCLGCSSTKYFSLTTHYLNSLSLSDWAGSRAGSPVSQYVQEIFLINLKRPMVFPALLSFLAPSSLPQ